VTVGIYCYKDKQKNNEIVYIGKDSYINEKRRYKNHLAPSFYDEQQINKVLQNNPNRYEYEKLKEWELEDYNPNLANALEIIYIHRYNPKFNFTIGGEGVLGFKHSNESRKKMSEAHKGKKFSLKHRQAISNANKGNVHSEETKKKMRENNARYWLGKKHSDEYKRKMSESCRGLIPWNTGKTLEDYHKIKISKNCKW
jgi:hypothetical protein